MVMTDLRYRQINCVERTQTRFTDNTLSLSIKDHLLSSLPLQPSVGEPMYNTMGDGSNDRRSLDPTGKPLPADDARGRRWFVLGCLVAFTGAVVPAWCGLTGRPWQAYTSGLVVTGATSLLTAFGLIIWWLLERRRGTSQIFQLLIGLAVFFWGAGQVWSAVDATDGAVASFSIGDVIGFASTPIGLLGVLSLPRRSASPLPGLRLVLDSVATGAAMTFLLLQLVLLWPDRVLDLDYLGTSIFILADCSALSAVVLSVVRDSRSRLWPAAIGMLFHVVADLSLIAATAAPGPRVDPWWSMSLWCLAWPLMGLGVARFRPSWKMVLESTQDRRESTSLQVATLVILPTLTIGLVIGGLSQSGAASASNLMLGLLFVPMLCLREMMDTQLRSRLTAGLRAQAFRDSLTGLPNRRALTARIDELERDDVTRDDVARVVLTLDLDGFKQVNDLLGHHAGDALLVAVADALQENCPPEALIARIGGDEFAVLCRGDLVQGRELAELLRKAITRALALLAPGVGISASVGVGRLVRPAVAGSPPGATVQGHGAEHRDQLTGLVESAAALRAAKESGRDAVQVYDGQVAQARERRLLLEHRLRLAIVNRTIITFGQPIVDLTTGRLTGFESLARWTDEELGTVSPDEFIEVAERTGLVVDLGQYLLAETLAAASAAGVFAAGLTLSVNASPIQLRVPGFVEQIRHEMSQNQVSPDQMIIEITEAILVTEGDLAVSTLAEINALGIGLAIDDFGTGYSALGYLRRLPVQVIKIDKSLTSSLLSEAKTLAIVEGVARMAHRMGVRVVMEGIESEREADVCRSVGADRGQGYLFGRPLPWAEAGQLIVEMAARPARSPVQ
jgi:diguanylate cyclase (GGDEF)-like protein